MPPDVALSTQSCPLHPPTTHGDGDVPVAVASPPGLTVTEVDASTGSGRVGLTGVGAAGSSGDGGTTTEVTGFMDVYAKTILPRTSAAQHAAAIMYCFFIYRKYIIGLRYTEGMISKTVTHAWAQDAQTLLALLESDEVRGLRSASVARAQASGSDNSFGDMQGRSLLLLFVRQFASPLIMLLLVAAGLTVWLHEWIDTGVILLAVGTSVALGLYQEYKAERATQALRSYITMRARVIRDGVEREVDAREVVVGDILLVRAGERVAADARVMSLRELAVDESILTGESLPVRKDELVKAEDAELADRTNMLFGGTFVAEGQGVAVVVAIGLATEFGKIAGTLLSNGESATPLQKAVGQIGWIVTLLALALVAGVYVVGVSRGMDQLELFLIAVAIAVGAIPEALPPGLTATLAVGVERIAKKKGIVRSLLAAETLGSATVVITDKTGTLTEGKLQLVEVYTAAELQHAATGVDSVRVGRAAPHRADIMHDMLALAVTNTNVLIENSLQKPERWNISGRPLEVSVVRAAGVNGVPVDAILRTIEVVKLFNSKDKYSSARAYVSLRTELIGAKHGTFEVVMGAPDILLAQTHAQPDAVRSILATIDLLSREGKRLVGVAVRGGGGGHAHAGRSDTAAHHPLTLVGVLVFYDPLRAGMQDSITEIESTGVRVIMATGDLPGTAHAIAGQLGWHDSMVHVLTGDAVRAMSGDELVDVLARVRIFARMTPDDKYKVIGALQARGEVVAMLGDGVNDAPSLKRADIGVAVGSGTDVAKGVADLVLLDDNFHTIKAAIDEGKLILENIRKIFIYLMSNSLDEIVLLGGSIFLGLTLPLSPLQVIWVNFFTGSIPAIAYAFDTEYVHQVRQRGHTILNRDVVVLSFGIGTLSSFGLLALHYVLITYAGIDSPEGRTFLFACFASYVLFLAFSIRNVHKPLFSYQLFGNRILNIGTVLGLVLLAATIYVPFFQNVFGTVALSGGWLALLTIWVLGNILLVEVAKFVLARLSRRSEKI